MKAGLRLLGFALLCMSFASAASLAGAATVRGRLVHQKGGPAAGIQVTVSSPSQGRSEPGRSGSDGIYYLYNIKPGKCYLEVWIDPGKPPTVYQIQVTDKPYTDVPQVTVP
jgi:hypothetical protein